MPSGASPEEASRHGRGSLVRPCSRAVVDASRTCRAQGERKDSGARRGVRSREDLQQDGLVAPGCGELGWRVAEPGSLEVGQFGLGAAGAARTPPAINLKTETLLKFPS